MENKRRVVLKGIEADPANWFMGPVDLDDWLIIGGGPDLFAFDGNRLELIADEPIIVEADRAD